MYLQAQFNNKLATLNNRLKNSKNNTFEKKLNEKIYTYNFTANNNFQ